MSMARTACPACQAVFTVPSASVGKKGRCRACGGLFVINLPGADPERDRADEKQVFDWLADDADIAAQPAAPPAAGAQTSGGAHRYPVSLARVDDSGAFFLFDPNLLHDAQFRASMPQRCVVCGGQQGLRVYRVSWPARLAQTAPALPASRGVPLDSLGGKSGLELASSLPAIDEMPSPYCLAFPYYVCRACPAEGAVVAEVRPGSNGREVCELGIVSLPRAEEFIEAVCGANCAAYRQLAEAIHRHRGDAWRLLPLTARSRINQWFKPEPNDHFLLFVPDADFSKTEHGQAGAIVSTRHMVVHKSVGLMNMPHQEPAVIRARPEGQRVRLHIRAHTGREMQIVLDPAHAELLRAELRRQDSRIAWQQ